MGKQIAFIVIRFVLTWFLFLIATIHTLVIAVPDASRPSAVLGSVIAALLIAMYDIGVFRVDIDSSHIDFR